MRIWILAALGMASLAGCDSFWTVDVNVDVPDGALAPGLPPQLVAIDLGDDNFATDDYVDGWALWCTPGRSTSGWVRALDGRGCNEPRGIIVRVGPVDDLALTSGDGRTAAELCSGGADFVPLYGRYDALPATTIAIGASVTRADSCRDAHEVVVVPLEVTCSPDGADDDPTPADSVVDEPADTDTDTGADNPANADTGTDWVCGVRACSTLDPAGSWLAGAVVAFAASRKQRMGRRRMDAL